LMHLVCIAAIAGRFPSGDGNDWSQLIKCARGRGVATLTGLGGHSKLPRTSY